MQGAFNLQDNPMKQLLVAHLRELKLKLSHCYFRESWDFYTNVSDSDILLGTRESKKSSNACDDDVL